MERALTGDQKTWDDQKIGTLAIDLGNSTTVVAFQEENSINPRLLELPPISRVPGEIPSLVVQSQNETPNVLVGQQVLNLSKAEKENINICSDFKRWIGADQPPLIGQSTCKGR